LYIISNHSKFEFELIKSSKDFFAIAETLKTFVQAALLKDKDV
jgi:hypothetical protein